MESNLYKSDEGWRRFRERTDSGARARRAFMRSASKPRPHVVPETPDLPSEETIRPPRESVRFRNRRRVTAPEGKVW